MKEEIIAIKDNILQTVGNDCEKIILFGSHAYGTPGKSSDIEISCYHTQQFNNVVFF